MFQERKETHLQRNKNQIDRFLISNSGCQKIKEQYCQSSGGKLFEHWKTVFNSKQTLRTGGKINIFSDMQELSSPLRNPV